MTHENSRSTNEGTDTRMSTTMVDEKSDEKVDAVEVDSPTEVSKRLREREERKAEKKAAREKKQKDKKAKVTRLTLLRDKFGGGPRPGTWGIPVFVWSIGMHALVLLFDYVLVMVTATGGLPTTAMWLDSMSGAATGGAGVASFVAMWVVPLVFVVAILTVAEIVVMRGAWRWASRRIAAMKAKYPTNEEKTAQAASDEADSTEKRTTGTQSSGSKKKRNRKRSK